MTQLPVGTVTMLFSDIEASTALVRELGPAWPDVLTRMRELCRTAWKEYDGHELGTEGDSFFLVFATAPDAVRAAVAAQHAIAHETWPAPVRMRIGIHTGHPQRHTEGYVGIDVHRAARISAAAHGGQIVTSAATRDLVIDELTTTADIGFRELGRHRLKDIPDPVRLFQVTSRDLTEVFPPLHTQGGAGSLPPELTPTVGRDGERAELARLLDDPTNRLITLTGPGGTGKTRLALALARDLATDFRDGVYFVPLENSTTALGIWSGIGDVLGVPADAHTPPKLFDHLTDRHALLILDNLEQNVEGAAAVRELLAGARHVVVVATSRRPLHVAGEYEHAVPPLLLPPGDSFDDVATSGAGQLFLEHARRARRGFTMTEANAADIARLVRALDGLPLAVELVAARVKLLTPKALLSRIDQTLDVSATDEARPGRQRTLRAAIAWSYDLLPEQTQTVLDHLSVFEGGASIEAISEVAPVDEDADVVDVLYDLADTGLIRVMETPDGEPRVHLLESVRRFAQEKLRAKGLYDAAITAHAQHFYDLFRDIPFRLAASEEWLPLTVGEFKNLAAVIRRLPSGVRDRQHFDDETVPRAHLAHALLAACRTRFPYVAETVPLVMGRCDDVDPHSQAALETILADALLSVGQHDRAKDIVTRVMASRRRAHLSDADSSVRPADATLDLRLCVIASDVAFFADRSEGVGDIEEMARAIIERSGTQDRHHLATYHHVAYNCAYAVGDFEVARHHLSTEVGLVGAGLTLVNNLADLEMQLGHRSKAHALLSDYLSAPRAASAFDLLSLCENYAEIVGPSHPRLCARVLGAVEEVRTKEGLVRTPYDMECDAALIEEVRPLLTAEEWVAAYERGRGEQLADLLQEMAALPPIPD